MSAFCQASKSQAQGRGEEGVPPVPVTLPDSHEAWPEHPQWPRE